MSGCLLSRPVRDVLAWLPVTEHVVCLPIGTNGYATTWGALTDVCPPKAQ